MRPRFKKRRQKRIVPKKKKVGFWIKIGGIVGLIAILAGIAEISGYSVASLIESSQMARQTNEEYKEKSIAVSKLTTTVEFIQSYSRLKNCYTHRRIENREQFVDDLNFVMGKFDEIALHIHSKQIDGCIIKTGVYATILDFMPILDFCSYPSANREKFDQLYGHLSSLTKCD